MGPWMGGWDPGWVDGTLDGWMGPWMGGWIGPIIGAGATGALGIIMLIVPASRRTDGVGWDMWVRWARRGTSPTPVARAIR
eukprot:gene3958-biopygen1961